MITTPLRLLITLTLMLAALPAPADVANQCIDCHQSEALFSRHPKLHRYYQEWILSAHSANEVTCEDCHGGQATADTAEQAHRGVYPVGNVNSRLHFARQPETCGSCHRGKRRDFEQSMHFGALMEGSQPAPTCTTCHPAMNKRPSYRLIVLNACANCHSAGNEAGLPAVVDQAQDLLRHLNMAEGLMGWTSLHFGSHDWPGNSKVRFAQLERRYTDLVSQVHRFNLAESEQATMSLLSDLRAIFEAERRTVEEP